MNEAVFQVCEFVLCLLFWASAFTLLSCEMLLILHMSGEDYFLFVTLIRVKSNSRRISAQTLAFVLCIHYLVMQRFPLGAGADLSEPNA